MGQRLANISTEFDRDGENSRECVVNVYVIIVCDIFLSVQYILNKVMASMQYVGLFQILFFVKIVTPVSNQCFFCTRCIHNVP